MLRLVSDTAAVRGSNQGVGEEFGHVTSADGSEVIDLMAAACAGGDDDGSVGLAANGVGKGFGNFQREFVF